MQTVRGKEGNKEMRGEGKKQRKGTSCNAKKMYRKFVFWEKNRNDEHRLNKRTTEN